VAAQRQPAVTRHTGWLTVGAVAAGGAVGAAARYAVDLAVPWHGGGLPWGTLAVNVTGCLLMGVLMAVLLRRPDRPPLVRPFLGTGVLGGYTTFSAFALQVLLLNDGGDPVAAAVYLAGTPVAAVLAVYTGSGATRWLLSRRTTGQKGAKG
jgi:CrcB protein